VTVKIGPWGAAGGTPCDINMYSSPRCLRNVDIWSDDTPGGCIKGLAFTYADRNDEHIIVNIGGCSLACGGVNNFFAGYFVRGRIIGAIWNPECFSDRQYTIKSVLLPSLSRRTLFLCHRFDE
jgi:hypothetical protein